MTETHEPEELCQHDNRWDACVPCADEEVEFLTAENRRLEAECAAYDALLLEVVETLPWLKGAVEKVAALDKALDALYTRTQSAIDTDREHLRARMRQRAERWAKGEGI